MRNKRFEITFRYKRGNVMGRDTIEELLPCNTELTDALSDYLKAKIKMTYLLDDVFIESIIPKSKSTNIDNF